MRNLAFDIDNFRCVESCVCISICKLYIRVCLTAMMVSPFVVGGMGSLFGSERIGIEFGVVALGLLIIRPSMLQEVRDRQLLS